jgi:hypothetical protein
MIPKEGKNRAARMALLAFGLLLIGTLIGLAWVAIYAPK